MSTQAETAEGYDTKKEVRTGLIVLLIIVGLTVGVGAVYSWWKNGNDPLKHEVVAEVKDSETLTGKGSSKTPVTEIHLTEGATKDQINDLMMGIHQHNGEIKGDPERNLGDQIKPYVLVDAQGSTLWNLTDETSPDDYGEEDESFETAIDVALYLVDHGQATQWSTGRTKQGTPTIGLFYKEDPDFPDVEKLMKEFPKAMITLDIPPVGRHEEAEHEHYAGNEWGGGTLIQFQAGEPELVAGVDRFLGEFAEAKAARPELKGWIQRVRFELNYKGERTVNLSFATNRYRYGRDEDQRIPEQEIDRIEKELEQIAWPIAEKMWPGLVVTHGGMWTS